MEQAELASLLAAADEVERAALLARYRGLVDAGLAWALKRLYDHTESIDPTRAARAAAALGTFASCTHDVEVHALAAWTIGMATLDAGQMEEAIMRLEAAQKHFLILGQPQTAAATQVSKLIALAMLGRYDQAIACGQQTRDVFLEYNDILAAGKIEQNLGNIDCRRDRYREAEQFYHAARERFVAVGEPKQIVQIDVCLAVAQMFQHKFRSAALLYEQALARAEAVGLEVTQAEIECDLGCLALFQGRYDRALGYLERSRRRYAALGMPHGSAVADLELADAYLELNLAPEAAAIYARVIPTFAELGMRAEQARALAYSGRACLLLDQMEAAHTRLAEAHAMYAAEGNAVGVAIVALIEAQLCYRRGDYAAAVEASAVLEAPFASAGAQGHAVLTRWLRGEALRALGQRYEALTLLKATLSDAEQQPLPQVAQRCHTSLGLLAAEMGDLGAAETSFMCAVALIEQLRAPLPAEEFHTAFIADKLTPYAELVRLCLAGTRGGRVAEAFDYSERARSRALAEMLGGAMPQRRKPRDPFEAAQLMRLEELREELNWFYSQINRPPDGETPRSAAAMADLNAAVREREDAVAEIMRQFQQRGGGSEGDAAAIPDAPPYTLAAHGAIPQTTLPRLLERLGTHTALVEYFALDGELLAFVVTDAGVEVVRGLAHETEVDALVEELRFQIETLRYGVEQLSAHLDRIEQRVQHFLRALYNRLIDPIEAYLGERRLVIVPYRMLHYIPFHALHDSVDYLIERREICYAPSAGVLLHCMAQPERPLQRAVLLGVADEQLPRVRDEVAALALLFPEAIALLDEQATLAALREHAPAADVLHLACHGQFRPDNPLFSALRLGDGWLTVREAYGLELNCGLAVLSACETGVSAIAPGDELIGLARGFFSAGAPAMLVSLWTVDDDSTATFMSLFYRRLQAGDRPAAALRFAQCQLLRQHAHPFFWSPFVLLGRW
jgi:CHAT domain-containing protein/tetratricopeptide (TPR) repeat protein